VQLEGIPMKINEAISPFEMGDWIIYKNEYIELLKKQDIIGENQAMQLNSRLRLRYVEHRYARYRLATENEIKKIKIKNIFINQNKEI
jgi:hypothetical protein